MQKLAYFLVTYGLKNNLTAFLNPGLLLKLLIWEFPFCVLLSLGTKFGFWREKSLDATSYRGWLGLLWPVTMAWVVQNDRGLFVPNSGVSKSEIK